MREDHPTIDMVGPIVVGNNVYLGYGAMVLPGVTIGDNSVIGAHAVVSKDIPPNCVAVGVPARPVRSSGEYRENSLARGHETKLMSPQAKRTYYETLYQSAETKLT